MTPSDYESIRLFIDYDLIEGTEFCQTGHTQFILSIIVFRSILKSTITTASMTTDVQEHRCRMPRSGPHDFRLVLHSPLQLQKMVHFCPFFRHPHFLLHSFLQ